MEKNYLFGFYINQKALIDNSIELSTDAIFVLYTMLLSSESVEYRREAKEIDGEVYFWFSHLEIAKQLPILFLNKEIDNASIKKRIYRLIKELITQNLVKSYQNTQIEQKTYYCFTKKGLKFWADSRKIPLDKNDQAPYTNLSKPLDKNAQQLENYRLETLNKFKERNCDFGGDSLNLPCGAFSDNAGTAAVMDSKDFLTSRQNISLLITVTELSSALKEIYQRDNYILGEVIAEINKIIPEKAQNRSNPEIISWVTDSWAKYFLSKNIFKAPIASRKNPTIAQIHNSVICMLGRCKPDLLNLFSKNIAPVIKKSETDILMDKLNRQLLK